MIGNPKLREKSSKVTEFKEELQEKIQDLTDTLKHLQETKKIGRALAAPQIGYMKQIICYNLPKNSFIMINPKIYRIRSNEATKLFFIILFPIKQKY